MRFRGEATRYKTTHGFRLLGCRRERGREGLAPGCRGNLGVWVSWTRGKLGMIWRAEDAVRARKMNGAGETEGAREGALVKTLCEAAVHLHVFQNCICRNHEKSPAIILAHKIVEIRLCYLYNKYLTIYLDIDRTIHNKY